MGRPEKEIKEEDVDVLFDLLEKGAEKGEIAKEFGMSIPTLSKRITAIQEKQGLVLQYRALQNLQLTELQAQILEAVTPDKIDGAPLRDLIFAYKILKDKELVALGKPTDIKGMMHYLIELEEEEMAVKEVVETEEGEVETNGAGQDLTTYNPKL